MVTPSISSTSIPNYITSTNSNNNHNRFDNLINKYRTRGLDAVADFLATKARKSKRTVLTFSFVIDYLNKFIIQNYQGYDIQTILPLLKSDIDTEKKIDVYKLLNNFISYLQNDTANGSDLSPATLNLYMSAAKSYFQFNDIDIHPSRFKYRVSLPTVRRQDEQPIDSNDIKEILHHCNNRRLKAFILVLASGGMRASEALAIREIDIDFGSSLTDKNEPAKVKIRKEYSKTRTERRIFISNEAARYLHEWIEWKYRDRTAERKYALKNRLRSENELIFSTVNATDPYGIYFKMSVEFQKALEAAGLASRKEDGVYKRRKITFHSFRRFVKTTIANQSRNSDYSEWFLGHKKSSYYINKDEELKRIYKEDCMKYLTFLDYPTLEATGRGFEAQLKQKDNEIAELKRKVQELSQGTDDIKELKEKAKQFDLHMNILDEFQRELNSLKLQINSENSKKKNKG
jgi:integrase